MTGAATLTISIFSLPPWLAAASILVLAALVLAREGIGGVSLSFAGVALAVGLWLGAVGAAYSAPGENEALWWARLSLVGVAAIAPAAYLFTLRVLGIHRRHTRLIWLSWAVALLLAGAAMMTDELIAGVYSYWWGYYTRFGPLGAPFLVFFGLLLAAGLRHYAHAYRAAAPGKHRRRIRRLMLAFAVGYLAVLDVLPAYGLELYPFGYLPILGFVAIAASAARTYRLGDITPAFAAEEIIDTMGGALLLMTPDGVIRGANRAAEELFATDRKELIGRPVNLLVPGGQLREQIETLLWRGQVRDYELSYRAPSGEQHTLSITASVIRDPGGEAVAIVCGAQDITAYKQAAEQARHQSEYLSALHATGLGLLQRLELSNLLEAIIQRAASLVGTTHGYIYVAAAEEDELVVTAGVGVFARNIGFRLKRGVGLAGRVWETGKPLNVDDYRSWERRATGLDPYNFHAVVGVPLTSGSKVVGVLGLAYMEPDRTFGPDEIDVLTRFAQLASIALDNARLYEEARQELERRRVAQEEIRQLNESLERRVAERTAQLEDANRVLQNEVAERMRAEEELAQALVREQEARAAAEDVVRAREVMMSVVSHDLRNPLSAIKGSAGLLRRLTDKARRDDDEHLRAGLNRIETAASKMNLLIDELLDFARLQAGQPLELGRRYTDLVALAAQVVSGHQYYARSHKIELIAAESEITGLWDPMRLERVLDNLIANAIKYSPEGSEIRVELRKEEQDGPWAVLVVRDEGMGIPAVDLPHVFDWFHRASNVSGRIKGTGIGLASSLQVIEQHGGTMSVASEEGRGTTFTIRLRMAARMGGARAESSPAISVGTPDTTTPSPH